MFHRFPFSDDHDRQWPDNRKLLDSAAILKLDFCRDSQGNIEINWQVSGTVSPEPEDDEDRNFMHSTHDMRLVESLVAAFTAKRSGGDV